MKKNVGKLLVLSSVLLSVFFIADFGNNEGKKAYQEFKERYAIDFFDSDKLEDYYLSIYDVKDTFYVKLIEENGSSYYHKWNKSSDVKEGRVFESEGNWTRLVGNAEPIYEQNMK